MGVFLEAAKAGKTEQLNQKTRQWNEQKLKQRQAVSIKDAFQQPQLPTQTATTPEKPKTTPAVGTSATGSKPKVTLTKNEKGETVYKVDTGTYNRLLENRAEQLISLDRQMTDDERQEAEGLANKLWGWQEKITWGGTDFEKYKSSVANNKQLTPEQVRSYETMANEAQKRNELKGLLISKVDDDKRNEVYRRYNIDPETFDEDDFKKWGAEHHFTVQGGWNTGVELNYAPNENAKGIFQIGNKRIGVGGSKKSTTEQADADAKVLLELAQYNTAIKESAAAAKEHPVLTSALTVAAQPARSVLGMAAGVDDTVRALMGKPVNTKSAAHRGLDAVSNVRQTVSDEYASKWFDGAELPVVGNVGNLAYNSLMTIGDMAVASLTAKAMVGGSGGVSSDQARSAVSKITSGMLATESGANAVSRGKERGLSDGQAVLFGIASGAAEFLTEQYSMEQILKEPKTVLGGLFKGFVAEGSEEMASNVLTKIADDIISGDNSELRQQIQERIANGESEQDAIRNTILASLMEDLGAGIAGGIVGFGLSGFSQATNAVTGRGEIQTNQESAVANEGNRGYNEIEAYEQDSKMLNPVLKAQEDYALSDDETYALSNYKSSWSYVINDRIRNNATLSNDENAAISSLNMALDKLPVYAGKVYRNIGFVTEESLNNFLNEHTKGSVVTYPSFTSASKTATGYEIADVPYLVRYEIIGENSHDVSNMGITEEQEVLFKTNSSFRVLDIVKNGNTVNLVLEEVGNDGREVRPQLLQDRGNGQNVGSRAAETVPGQLYGGVRPQMSGIQGGGGGNDGLSGIQSASNAGTGREGVSGAPGEIPARVWADVATERLHDGISQIQQTPNQQQKTAPTQGGFFDGNTSQSQNSVVAPDAQDKQGQPVQTTQQEVGLQETDALQSAKEKIARYSENTGRKVVWYNDQSMPEHADENGFYENGTLYINENAEDPYMEVFKHELFHSLDGKDKQAVIDFFKKNVAQNTKEFLDYKTKTIQAHKRKNLNYSTDDFWEEYAAQNSEFLLDEKTIDNMAKTNRTLAEKILEKIKELIAKIKSVFSAPKDFSADVAGHESGMVSGLSDTQLQKAQALYEKALYGASGTTDLNGKAKYDIIKESRNTEGELNGYEQNGTSGKLGRFANPSENERPARVDSVGQVQSEKANTPHTKRIHRSGVSAETLTSSGLTAEQATIKAQDKADGFKAEFYTEAKYDGVPKIGVFNTEHTAYYPDDVFERNDIIIKDGVASFTEKRFNDLIHEFSVPVGGQLNRDYAKGYVAYISPTDFLSLTTVNEQRIIDDTRTNEKYGGGKIDIERLSNNAQTPYLEIDFEDGIVTDHEGRHRMVMLRNAGVKRVAIVVKDINPESDKYHTKKMTNVSVAGQKFNVGTASGKVNIGEVIPLSPNYRNEVREKFVDVSSDISYSLKKSAEGEHSQGKADRYQRRHETNFMRAVADILSIPKTPNSNMPIESAQAQLRPLISQIAAEVTQNGAVSQDTADAIFEEAYRQGRVIEEDYYNQYKPLRDEIRTRTVQVSEQDRSNIPDFERFRRSNLGTVRISKDSGVPVDVMYQDLNDRYPDLFPDDITHPADQLMHIVDVAKGITKVEHDLDEYYDADADTFKAYAREEFDKALAQYTDQVQLVNRYKEDAAKAAQTPQNDMTPEDVKSLYQQASALERNRRKVVDANLLTDRDNVQVDRLLKGEITLDELPKNVNHAGIEAVYKATKAVEDLLAPAKDYAKNYKARLRQDAARLFEGADGWKDKKVGLLYSRETMERNIRDITNNDKEAEVIIDYLFTPVHKNEAKSTKLKNEYRQRVKDLNLSKKESEAVQVLGELDYKIAELNGKKRRTLQEMGELTRLKDEREKYISDLNVEKRLKNAKVDMEKVNRAISEFRSIYNELFELANDALIRNGYAPIEYRKGYFPHFTENKTDSLFGKLAQKLGININVQELPTDIAGLTNTFRPGKQFFANFLQRTGDKTVNDAVRGFDNYIEGIANVIHHTDDIQRLRAAEDAIRYKFSDEGTKAEIDAIRDDPNIAEEDKQNRLKELYGRDPSNLSHFVQELRTYTDMLAGKKHIGDRGIEHDLGRGIYDISRAVQNTSAANMVGANITSALTNFIPLAQGGAGINQANMLHAAKDTLTAMVKDDGFTSKSTFLTNRKGSKPLVQSVKDKASDVANALFTFIDNFTSQTLTRAKYYQNMKNGMDEEAAIESADKYAASVIGDRSKGSVPTLFEQKNPLTRLFTAFQLEVNNQYSFLFKDLPREVKNESKHFVASLALVLAKYFIGSWIYNELSEKLTGRRPTFDPVGMLADAYEDFTDEDKSTYQALADTAQNVAEQVPVLGSLLGGGRIPISQAIPDIPKTVEAITELSSDADKSKPLSTLGKELTKPASNLLLPFGGNQLRKTIEGGATLKAGGSYTYDKDGNKVLQFPIEDTGISNTARALLFGKYATDEGSEWVESGFISLSAANTEHYEKARAAGISYDTFMEAKKETSKMESDKDKKGNSIPYSKSLKVKEYIDSLGLNNEQRKILYDACSVSEKVQKGGVK